MPTSPIALTPNKNKEDLKKTVAEAKAKVAALAESNKDARQGGPLNGIAPRARRGESALTSRGYSYGKLFLLMGKKIQPEDAKVEAMMHNDLQKNWYEAHGATRTMSNTILAPFGMEFMPQVSDSEVEFTRSVRQCVKAGVANADLDEIRSIAHKVNKTLSWQDETALGALVSPPQFGELIEVFRNNEIFLQAGAQTIPMPPNGRIVYPRQTGASTAYYVGENQAVTDSAPTTGDVTLQAKKLAALIKAPNELFRYASVSAEAFLRQDMMKVLGLAMDKAFLEGAGSSTSPKGLINYAGINQYTSLGTPADGNSGFPFQPEDVYKMIATVEEQNAKFNCWVMRPLMWTYIQNRRADAVTSGDGKGAYLFNWMRDMAYNPQVDRDTKPTLSGYTVHKSTQVSATRTRGSGTTNNTYILAGDFQDYIVALSPTIEFATTIMGDTAFTNDQTWIRAILNHDGMPRHEESFILADQLIF